MAMAIAVPAAGGWNVLLCSITAVASPTAAGAAISGPYGTAMSCAQMRPVAADRTCPPITDRGWLNGLTGPTNKSAADDPNEAMRRADASPPIPQNMASATDRVPTVRPAQLPMATVVRSDGAAIGLTRGLWTCMCVVRQRCLHDNRGPWHHTRLHHIPSHYAHDMDSDYRAPPHLLPPLLLEAFPHF
eukprot:m.361900 g.361900  ORF g.361900 m.361900 type:complete len:188 (-) comp28058_c0_seq1:168-731(-)